MGEGNLKIAVRTSQPENSRRQRVGKRGKVRSNKHGMNWRPGNENKANIKIINNVSSKRGRKRRMAEKTKT